MKLLQKYMSNGSIQRIKSGAMGGDPADRLIDANGDVGVLRPFKHTDGNSYITHTSSQGRIETQMLTNTTATMRKDDWKIMDDAVTKAATKRLKLVLMLRGAGLTFTIPQGMGKTILETETQGEVNDAIISMDGVREGDNDRPEFEPSSLPMPITHKDFQFSARQIIVSRSGGSPLDTTTMELSGEKVAESVERLALGRIDTYTFGGGSVYGLLNYPQRMTRTITSPTAAGWTGTTFLTEVMQMRLQSTDTGLHFGPWTLFVAPNWDLYLDGDFKTASDRTLRERVKAVNGISDIVTLDYMEDYDILLVQESKSVIRLVIGMDITTLQWDTLGGMQKNFKVMTIVVPQLRSDINSRTGIVHGSV